MLKFFRLYQKYILAIGAVVLMIAFLIPQATQMFVPGPGSQVVGTIDGKKLRQREVETGAAELHVLGSLNPLFTILYEEDATAWMLAVHEAESLGLSAGPLEVNQMLSLLQVDEAALHRLAGSVHADVSFVRNAIRHWIMVETYRSLALGETRTPSIQRLENASQIAQAYGAQAFPQMANYLGQPRLSAPLLKRVIFDQGSTVSGKLLVVPADTAITDLPDPTEDELQALFEAHKDHYPSSEDPIGYRLEPRVKLDYLTIPFADVLKTVEVDEVEAIGFHENNPTLFKDDAGELLGYDAAREQVITTVRQRKAQDKIDMMIRRARAILMEAPEFRRLTEQNGYMVLPEGYTPMSLRIVADTIEEEFGVRPALHLERDRWLTLDDLVELDGIGFSSLADRDDIFFISYVLSARELEPAAENPLVGLRLQTNVVSQPLASPDGSRHLFRLIAAEPDQPPADLDAVREQVTTDARKIAAFNQIKDQADAWRVKAADQGLDSLATGLGLNVIDLPAVRRVGGNEREVPTLPGVGSSDVFIRAVYETADKLTLMNKTLSELPVTDRLVVVPLEERAALALFRLDDARPISQSDYNRLAANPQWRGTVGFATLSEELPNPLSYDALAKVTDYDSTFRDRDEDEDEAADEASEPDSADAEDAAQP